MAEAGIKQQAQWLLGAAFWIVLLFAIAWFLNSSLSYAFTRDPQPGATLLNRQIWYVAHIASAVPLLLIGPLQFSPNLRRSRPRVHRLLGRIFLGGSLAGGLLAIYIGATIQYQGSRLPLALFGALWVFFAVAAWRCARAGAYAQHRRFVIRTFAIALAFVWVRVLGVFAEDLLFFIDAEEMRDATREWLSFVLPLLVVEFVLSWWPELRKGIAARA